jgi:hypothetical protein
MTVGSKARGDITVHGFRSTFRDWAAERTNFPSEVVEMALVHTVGDKVEAAYRRGDLLDEQRRLMGAWAESVRSPRRRPAEFPAGDLNGRCTIENPSSLCAVGCARLRPPLNAVGEARFKLAR